MKHKEKLDELYKEALESPFCPPENKIQFLGEYIFDFTTYDFSITEILANKMLEVIRAISEKTTFEYIKDENNYLNYLTMVNMPFLANKINWWTSIRWAWFDSWADEIQINFDWSMKKDELSQFMKELLEWSELFTTL